MSKHKKLQGSGRPASIDGMVSGNRELGASAHRSYQPNRGAETPSLDVVSNRDDGFHPMRTGTDTPIGDDDLSLLDEPIVLEDEDPKTAKARQKLLKHKHKRPSRKRRWLKRIFLILAVGLVGALGFLAYRFYDAQRQILSGGGLAPAVCDPNVPPERLSVEGDSRINVLVVGIGGAEHAAGPNLSDTIMLVSIDPINHTASLLSVPRDLWVRIPGNGQNKINAVYPYGLIASKAKNANEARKAGLQALETALKTVIGVPIHYNVLVDFAALRQSVNAVGGIDIDVPKELAVYERLWDEGTGRRYTLDVEAGPSHFDGTRALFFSRSRYTSPRGDFDRTERQKLVMVALKDKIFTAGTFSNPVKLLQLLDSLGNNVYTDFDTEAVKCLYRQISQIPSANIDSLDMATPPNDLLTTGGVGNISVVRPKAGLFEYDEIQAYVRKSLPDGFLAKENAPVAVYNGTAIAGLATKQGDILKSYGYNVMAVDSAPTLTNPTKTVVVDLTKGVDKYTKHYLQERYGASAVTKMPAGTGITPPPGTHFVIILGSDVSSSQD